MSRSWSGLGFALLAVVIAAATVDRCQAQTYGWVQGTRYAPSPGYLGMTPSSPYYTTYGFGMNGNPPDYYSYNASGNLPTYMTSINYPWMYGSHGYPYAPGRYTISATESSFTTAPTNYGVYVSPTENRLYVDTAQTPLFSHATVDVRVPPTAELRFEGVRTGQTGAYRRFVTPPLDPASNYTYDISAIWDDNGRQVTVNRRVPLRAGDRLNVDLTTPGPTDTGGTSTLRTSPRQLP